MTTSQRALARTTPKRAALTIAKAQVSQLLSRRLPYYITPEEAHRLIGAAENDRDRLFLRLLWETGLWVSEAISVRLGDVSREGVRVLGKGSVERVVFVQDALVAAILFYAQEQAIRARRLPVSFEERWSHYQAARRSDYQEGSPVGRAPTWSARPLIPSRLRHQLPKPRRAARCASGAAGASGHQHYPHLPAPNQ